jgi:hypothetical protein
MLIYKKQKAPYFYVEPKWRHPVSKQQLYRRKNIETDPTSMAASKWIALAVAIFLPATAQPAEYQLIPPFHMVCEGILVSQNGAYKLVEDDRHLNSDSDDDRICLEATIAENSGRSSLKYTLKEREISRILKVCSVGKLCRIEGAMSGLTHDVYFFVKIDAVSAQ